MYGSAQGSMPHSTACRQRIIEKLNETEAGKLRVYRMLARADRYCAEEVEKGARHDAQGGIDSGGPQAEAPLQAFVPFASSTPSVPVALVENVPAVREMHSGPASTTPQDFEQPDTTAPGPEQEPAAIDICIPQQSSNEGMDVDLVDRESKISTSLPTGIRGVEFARLTDHDGE